MRYGATSRATTWAVSPAGEQRVGGQFWALYDAAGDADDKDGDSDGEESPANSPTPSDAICEAFRVGYSEKEVAMLVDLAIPRDDPARLGLDDDAVEIVRRVVHRRTAASAIRPRRGPLPKVSLPKPSLSDFFETGAWKMVQRKKKKKPWCLKHPDIRLLSHGGSPKGLSIQLALASLQVLTHFSKVSQCQMKMPPCFGTCTCFSAARFPSILQVALF